MYDLNGKALSNLKQRLRKLRIQIFRPSLLESDGKEAIVVRALSMALKCEVMSESE